MKKIIFILTMVLLPALASAQTAEFKKFYKTYDTHNNYTTFQMSGDMFVSLAGESQNSEQTISGIYIITTEKPSRQFKKDLNALILLPQYDLQTSINDDGDKVRIYVNKEYGKIVEILLTVIEDEGEEDDEEIVVMSMGGQNLSLDSVRQMAEQADELD